MKPEIHSQYLPKIVRYSNNTVSGEWSQKAWEIRSHRPYFEWSIDNSKDAINNLKIWL